MWWWLSIPHPPVLALIHFYPSPCRLFGLLQQAYGRSFIRICLAAGWADARWHVGYGQA